MRAIEGGGVFPLDPGGFVLIAVWHGVDDGGHLRHCKSAVDKAEADLAGRQRRHMDGRGRRDQLRHPFAAVPLEDIPGDISGRRRFGSVSRDQINARLQRLSSASDAPVYSNVLGS